MSRAKVRRDPPWTPFGRATAIPVSEAELQTAIREHAPRFGEAEVRAVYAARLTEELWKNSRYQVAVNRQAVVPDGWPAMVHLSIKRVDRAPIHDWRDLQRIKNELVGPEHEAVELYPAEERLVDSANQYHLWVLADRERRFPFGFVERFVTERTVGKAMQRPFEDAA